MDISFKVLEGVSIAQQYGIQNTSPRRGVPQSPTASQPVLDERVWSTNENITGLSETGKAESEAGHFAVQQVGSRILYACSYLLERSEPHRLWS